MPLRARLSRLIAARVVVSTLLLGFALVLPLGPAGAPGSDRFFVLIAATYALSVVWVASLRVVDRRRWLADAQLGCDALLVSGFIVVTGGIASVFSSLYVLPIVAASTIRARRVALQVAALSAVLYLGLVLAQYQDVQPLSRLFPGGGTLPTFQFAQYTAGINVFGFFAVALLGGSLAERVRTADARLASVSGQIADLRAFNAYVIDSLLSGLVTASADGRVLSFNKAAGVITGRAAAWATGRDVGEVLQLSPAFRESLGTLHRAKSLRTDLEYRTADHRTIEIGLTVASLFFPDGQTGYLVTFQDVTDVKRLERSARLRQRLAAVGEMAAGIAHEIRNPLASMTGSIQVLRGELALSDEQAQLMDIVLRESERLNDTIRSFLAYAKPQRFAVTRLDVRRAIQDTALLLRNSAEVAADDEILVDVPADPVWIEADEHQIRQVVWNLATNGLRAMEGPGRLSLSARHDPSSERGDEIVLAVEDDGRGMSQEELDGLFQPFRSSFERGTGLGLAIVHRIVTDYGGVVHVASTEGRGTAFRVHLPVAAVALSGLDAPAEYEVAS